MSQEARGIYDDLKNEGRPVTLRVSTTTGADPVSGSPGTTTTVDYTTQALELEITQVQRVAYAKDLGIDIGVATRSFMLAALGLLPGASDWLVTLPALTSSMSIVDSDGSVLSIISAGAMKPASEVLYYSVLARGA